jgi:hypothetical protein
MMVFSCVLNTAAMIVKAMVALSAVTSNTERVGLNVKIAFMV